MMKVISRVDPLQRRAGRGLFSACTHCWLIIPPRAYDKQTHWECRRVSSCLPQEIHSLASRLLFMLCLYHLHLHHCSPVVGDWLVWKSVPYARGVLQRPLNARAMIQHTDLSIVHLHVWTWPSMSLLHWDSSNSRSLRICNSKTKISHSTSKNCFKPEETMLFLQVCFKSTQILF